jgi:hypothetical protein
MQQTVPLKQDMRLLNSACQGVTLSLEGMEEDSQRISDLDLLVELEV